MKLRENPSASLEAGESCDYSLDHVIKGAVLCDGNERRLVVRSRVDRRKAVEASGEASGNIRGKNTTNILVVQTLEEDKVVQGVCRRRRVKGGKGVDDDVRVSPDVALRVDDLGRREVVLLRVHEVACLQVLDCHLDSEVRVRGDRRTVRREDELGRWHVRRRRNNTHRGRIAGALLDLLPIGDLQVRDRRAEVDEVVRRRERGDLSRRWLVLAVIREPCGNHRIKKRERGLRIAIGATSRRSSASSVVTGGSRG